ncbi:MAG: DUF4349 domain-containing protein, partial [Chloroflexi bacterium]|nr:DUF4349 domain-containing protein [Chloroflexota bacterium]
MKKVPWGLIAVSVFAVVVIVAIFFPVFAQSKVSASNTSALFSTVGGASVSEMPDNDAGRPAVTAGGVELLTGASNGVVGEAAGYGRQQISNRSGLGGGTGGGGSSQSVPPLTEMSTASMAEQQRQVIRNGEISVRVPDVEEAESKITDMVIKGGGYVESSSTDLPADNRT